MSERLRGLKGAVLLDFPVPRVELVCGDVIDAVESEGVVHVGNELAAIWVLVGVERVRWEVAVILEVIVTVAVGGRRMKVGAIASLVAALGRFLGGFGMLVSSSAFFGHIVVYWRKWEKERE